MDSRLRVNDRVLLKAQWPAPAGVHTAMTLRSGGRSAPPWSSWNLGDHVGDDPEHVAQNRRLLAERLGARPVFHKQVHGVEVMHVKGDSPDGGEADACVTDESGVACTMMVADCLPVLFASADGRFVGAAHAGWRGLASGVLENTLAALQGLQAAAHAPCDLLAWLGPCIGPQAFEVGDEVRHAFVVRHASDAVCFVARGDKWLADLSMLARAALMRAGLKQAQIFGNDGALDWCTVSTPAHYFSHRRDAARLGTTGRMAACIWRD